MLLLCARSQLAPGEIQRLRSTDPDHVDWTGLLQLAREHGQAPLLLKALTAAGSEFVPAEVLAALRADHAKAAGANLMLAGELLALLADFERAAIPAIPYKGPVLAANLFGDVALRPFSDLDILVRQEDRARAGQVLLARGFQRATELGRIPESAMLHNASSEDFRRGPFAVDLQWRAAKQVFAVRGDPERIWARAAWTVLMGRRVRTLAREDLLGVLVVHGSRHAWERLTWVSDIAEILRQDDEVPIDWDTVQAETESAGTARMLRVALALAHRAHRAPLPAAMRDWTNRDSTAVRLARQCAARLLRRPPTRAEYARFQLDLREGPAAKSRLILHAAFTPGIEDYALIRLPERFHPLYHLVRPARLFRQYALAPFRRVGHGP